ncbi:MAG: hypothetical protein AAGB48_04010 [Planctomycetota bacterium]
MQKPSPEHDAPNLKTTLAGVLVVGLLALAPACAPKAGGPPPPGVDIGNASGDEPSAPPPPGADVDDGEDDE